MILLIYPVPFGSIITQGFGENPEDYIKFKLKGHNGIDFAVDINTAIKASCAGKVIAAKMDTTGYGNYVKLDHGSGYYTLYGHLNSFSCRSGDTVKAGDIIGYSGNTGNSTGPHLHFELRVPNGSKDYNYAIDPLPYMQGEQVLYKVKIITDSLRIRSGPSTTYKSIGEAKLGEIYEVYEESGDWLRIEFNKWICKKIGGETYAEVWKEGQEKQEVSLTIEERLARLEKKVFGE